MARYLPDPFTWERPARARRAVAGGVVCRVLKWDCRRQRRAAAAVEDALGYITDRADSWHPRHNQAAPWPWDD